MYEFLSYGWRVIFETTGSGKPNFMQVVIKCKFCVLTCVTTCTYAIFASFDVFYEKFT